MFVNSEIQRIGVTYGHQTLQDAVKLDRQLEWDVEVLILSRDRMLPGKPNIDRE